MISEIATFKELSINTAELCVMLWFAWAFTLGPAVLLLRGRNAADLMFKVSLYVSFIALGTVLLNIWNMARFRMGEPLGYLFSQGYDGFIFRIDPPSLLIFWFCGGVAGHALIYSVSMLRKFWTTKRNRFAVVFYSLALVVGLLHFMTILYFWGNWNEVAERRAQPQLKANRELTDTRTQEYLTREPEAPVVLVLRANFLHDTGRYSEALPLYRKALRNLPQGASAFREGLEARIKETEEKVE